MGSDNDDDDNDGGDCDTKELSGDSGMRGVTVFGSITREGVTAVWSLLLPVRSDSEMEGCGVPSSDASVRMMRASVAAATAIDARIWSFVIATIIILLLCIRYIIY